MDTLRDLLEASRARHSHLCPRQVLGVRIALAGLKLLDTDPTMQRRKKSLLVISETDGCFVDGVEVTAQVSVGHRSLKIEDYGKIAATFVDIRSGRAVRVCPAIGVRELAVWYCSEDPRAYFAQLKAYQTIPDQQLLNIKWISLKRELPQILGSPKQRVCCIKCGEEIINGRESMEHGSPICVACTGSAYYHVEEALGIRTTREDKLNTL